jgi:pimeloyl-ACP methyl ester carboxylesterase
MNIKLHYTDNGSGEILILLHGNSEENGIFVHQIDYFSKKYRVIAIDTRGHGKSPRGTKPFTIRQFAEDLHEFMDEHGIRKAHILGFSDGGNIALVFAMKYPEYVDRLILNGANLDERGIVEEAQQQITKEYAEAVEKSKTDPSAVKDMEMLGLMVNDPNIDVNELVNVKSKTLVLTGKDDLILDEHSAMIAENIPDARWVSIPGDHWIANKYSKDFNRVVDEFLSE